MPPSPSGDSATARDAISLADLRAKMEQGLALAADGPGVATASVEGALLDVARERGSSAIS